MFEFKIPDLKQTRQEPDSKTPPPTPCFNRKQKIETWFLIILQWNFLFEWNLEPMMNSVWNETMQTIYFEYYYFENTIWHLGMVFGNTFSKQSILKPLKI